MDKTNYFQYGNSEIAVITHYSNSHKSVCFLTVVITGNSQEIINSTSYIPVSNINLVIEASQCAVMSGIVFVDNQNK